MQKKLYNSIFIFIPLLFINCNVQQKDLSSFQTLWYDQPAGIWEEALPLGNGRLGAMVFGDPINERIQLNDDSLWPHSIGWDEPEGTPKDLSEIRKHLINGNARITDSLLVEKFSNKSITLSHQTLGDLFLDWEHKEISEYYRSLDLNSAVSTTKYKTQGFLVIQKVFVSNPHQLIVVEIESKHPDGLNGNIKLNRPKDEGIETVSIKASDNKIIMTGEVTQRSGKFRELPVIIESGVKFETSLYSQHDSGKVITENEYLKVSGVKKLTLFIASNSNYYTQNYSEKNKKELSKIRKLDINKLEKDHVLDHQSLFNRVRLNLNADKKLESLTTDQRLERVKNGYKDNGLTQLLFDYGRYLLIGSSRTGTLPANLQGLWNQHIKAPWNADYHLNINLQMNYWLANSTGLHELNYPFFDYVDRLVENGKITAKKNFGLNGSIIPHASDLWAPTWLRARTAYWGSSFGAGGWLMQHYWHHYEYTNDLGFLKKRALPVMEQVAQFYSDWLIEDPRDQSLISAPSTSPENQYLNSNGEQVASCLGSAMDQQVIYETFSNYLKAAEIIGVQNLLTKKISQQLKKLRPGFVIGKDGRILEWDREYDEFEPGHRHMSHLYGFHPGTQITIDEQPELFKAVKKTLDFRLENGGAGTGWSRAWLISYSARLLDAEMAHEHIQLLFKKSIYKNLFDAHPPFQIDGNFGFTAGISEMLLQSHENKGIRILPALPKSWSSGSVEGLIARNNIKINMKWDQGEITELNLETNKNQSVSVIYKNEILVFDLVKDEPFYTNFKKN